MSQSNQAYIFDLCASLSKIGINPTLGTIRNKADRTLAIPEIISVLKMWKENPQQAISNNESQTVQEKDAAISLQQRVEKLETQLDILNAKLQKFIDAQE
jgi:hypothetical protein